MPPHGAFLPFGTKTRTNGSFVRGSMLYKKTAAGSFFRVSMTLTKLITGNDKSRVRLLVRTLDLVEV
jgi:hypothetical protein